MKKILIVLALIILVCGCGATDKALDGSDGKSGSDGSDGLPGRDFITPILYTYSWDVSGILCTINNPSTINIKIAWIGFDQSGSGNFIDIWVPANNQGRQLQAVINGTISAVMIIPNNTAGHYMFSTLTGTDYASGLYMNCKRLDNKDKDNYFIWYVDSIQKEFFFSDSFEN